VLAARSDAAPLIHASHIEGVASPLISAPDHAVAAPTTDDRHGGDGNAEARMGDDPKLMLGTYAHLLPQGDAAAAEAVATVLAPDSR
jgi:hypothetical protein